MHRPLFACLMAGAIAPVGAEDFASEQAGKTAEAREAEERREDDPSNPVPLDLIQVTATRAPVSAFDVSTAVTIVDSEEIAERTPQTIADYLRGQPGTFVQSTTPGQAIPIVRGLKGSEVLHIVDGFRLNTAIFRNSPNQYFALVDAQDVEQIEVVRGTVVDAVWIGRDGRRGAGADAGERAPKSKTGTAADISAPSLRAEIYPRLEPRRRGRTRRLFDRRRVTYQDVGERRIGGGPRQPHTDFRAWAGQTKVLWSPTSNNELTFNVQYLKQPKTPRYDELVTSFHQDSPNSDEFYFELRTIASLRRCAIAGKPTMPRSIPPISRSATRKSTTTVAAAARAAPTAIWKRIRINCAASPGVLERSRREPVRLRHRRVLGHRPCDAHAHQSRNG